MEVSALLQHTPYNNLIMPLRCSNLPEIVLPRNNSGTPKHPISWQREKLKPDIRNEILNFIKKAYANTSTRQFLNRQTSFG